MIRDEDGALTGYVYLDLKTNNYGGFVNQADKLLRQKGRASRRVHLSLGRASTSSSCAPSND